MANSGYKLQEFVAHSRSVKCLSIGRKARRLLLTGGEDQRVNLWAIGKSSSLLSLSGHSSSVECVAFDSAEISVLAGSASGAVKLWDLEESKLLRSLTGHKSKCTAIDFHPFGEFFASGSVDKDLKIWDIRKKGCMHTYKGHSLGINTIKFTPDGRWVVSGGLDSAVKVWDLTAGKLLHDFNFHDGPIRSINFHPQEFLLATGSADGTVKFWDLETFEIIGSTRVENAGVRAMSFHPDGRTLFCGNDENLKVYSWEPVICHDSVDMEWSTLGDLCINEQRLIGCSYYRNYVGIWAADLSLIKPYGRSSRADDDGPVELKPDLQESESLSSVDFRSMSPDVDMKEIKNIYVDYETPVNPKSAAGPSLSKVKIHVDKKELNKVPLKTSGPPVRISPKPNGHLRSKSFVVPSGPSIILREISDVHDFDSLRREPFGSAKASTRETPFHTRRASDNKYDMKRPPFMESRSLNIATGSIFDGLVSDTSSRDSLEEKYPIVNSIEDKLNQDLSASGHPNVETVDDSLEWKKPTNKVINGVAVVHGRTRSLVEKFEKWDKAISKEDQTVDPNISTSPGSLVEKFETCDKVISEEDQTVDSNISTSPGSLVEKFEKCAQAISKEDQTVDSNICSEVLADRNKSSTMVNEEPQVSGRGLSSLGEENIIEDLMQSHDNVLSDLRYRLTKLQMVRRFWEQNDFKGAINMMKKFPDYSVQIDVVGAFMDRMDIINLDLFSCLLPVLVNLLDSKTERHAKVSLEILLKLVAVFGHTICSAISAPPCVGVDLHQEERIACCRQCFDQLQKLQRALPEIARRSALLAKLGQDLNLILQVHSIS